MQANGLINHGGFSLRVILLFLKSISMPQKRKKRKSLQSNDWALIMNLRK
jgi:hypothetical protein